MLGEREGHTPGFIGAPKEIGQRYVLSKEIGKGAYGTVYLAEDSTNGSKVAIKRIDDVFRTKTDAKRTLREITILRQCNHQNICRLCDLLVPLDELNYKQLWMVQEYGGWDLSKILKNSKRINGWCDKHVRYIVYQLLCALLYMQSANIVHRDLKPSNILMDTRCNLKLIDYGLARQMNSQFVDNMDSEKDIIRSGNVDRQLTQHVVTRWYRAPELILTQTYYNSKIDIWSVGCIMAELLQTLEPDVTSSHPLFPGKTCFPLSAGRADRNKNEKFAEEFKSESHQLLKIFEILGTPAREDVEQLEVGPLKEYLLNLEPIEPQDLHDFYPNVDESALVLLRQMLEFNPQKRISIQDALESEFFRQVRNPNSEILSTEPMVFAFEYEETGNTAGEISRLRKLIYKEALLFNNSKGKSAQTNVNRTRSFNGAPNNASASKSSDSDSRSASSAGTKSSSGVPKPKKKLDEKDGDKCSVL